MPEVDAQARARLKQEAARTALLDSEIAQVLSAVAALASLFSPPHAAVLGIGSAAMGQCGNYRQSIANDPPRDDFDQVSITQARVNEDLVPVDEPKRTFYLFAAQHLILSDALFALLLSLERYDGAVNANNLDAASSQADAARQNAAAAVSIQESLPPLVHALNDGWHTLSAGSSLTFADLSLEQVQQFYREAWGSPPEAPGAALTDVMNSIEGAAADFLESLDVVAAHPILSATALPSEPSILIEDSYLDELNGLSAALGGLVVDT